ncbi:MAG: phosphoenolpyruvate carboxylase, partial [Alphaproteobacteria bacterium]|nr:phosphoenolpyruvate carboxylase [Alphaproteobacteria bacterium]
EYAVIRQNIIIILDNLKKDPSLYHNKEEVQKYINTLNYHLRNFSGKNDYKIAEVIDMLSKAIDTIENLKIECLIPVENQKRSPDIESHRMMEFLKEDGYNSQVLFEAIKTNVANFIKANSKGLKSSEILKNLNTLSHTMFIKTGTWAGDSAGKPRVTGDTIHKSYIENVENVIKNVINVIENGFNDVPSSIYMPGLRNLLDERIKNTQDPVDKATLNKIKTIVRNIVTSLEGIQTASQKNTSMHLSKHKLLQKFDVLWSSDTYLQVLDKYEDIASALLRTQSWISNNFHVNIYERTDAQVNQDAVNDLFKTFKKKTKSPLLNILKDKEFSDLTEDEKFTLLNNIMDLNSKEGQRIISLLNNEFHEILEHLNLDQTHPDYSSTVITELKRNRVVANGGYVEHLINDGQNIYTEYNSIYKSMIADTEKPSDVLSKMLLMRICSNNPKEPPKAHIIPLTENMEFFQTIKKTPKPPRKGKEENKPGLVHKLYTCDSYMQMLAMMGFKMTKMTAQSDTPRHNGVIGALHGIDYAIEKLKQVACHPDVMACIAKNSKFAISTTKDIKDYKSLETPRSYPKTVEISIKNGKGHNIMRNGGTALNYTVQGHNHTYANQAYQYMWNVISTWNNNLYPDTKYKDLVQTNEEIKKVYKIAKKFPNASSEAHRYRFFDNKQDDNFIE